MGKKLEKLLELELSELFRLLSYLSLLRRLFGPSIRGHRPALFLRPRIDGGGISLWNVPVDETSFGEIPVMKDEEKTKDQLINELVEMRRQIARLEALDPTLKRAEETRNELERSYGAFVENSPDVIYLLDPEGYIQFVGGPCESFLGFTREELKGKHFTSLVWGADAAEAEWHFNERRTGDRSTKGFELRLITKEGGRKPVDIKNPPVELHAVGIYNKPASAKERKFLGTFGLVRDITRRKQAEEQLVTASRELQDTRDMLAQAEKLAAIGRYTAGIAHEILNPVNIISMRLQLLRSSGDLSDQTGKIFDICSHQVDRINKFIRDLGQFSGRPEQHIVRCGMNEVIESVLTLCSPRLKEEGIKTEVTPHTDLPLVPLYRDRVEQVLFNVISNAIEAMMGREDKWLRIATTLGDSTNWVRIIVSDTGPGVNPGHKSKIFDPFFSTKDSANGTGLGLFVSYNIIKDHGGRIWAEQNEWGGASFIMELPRVQEKETQGHRPTIGKEGTGEPWERPSIDDRLNLP